MTRFTGSWATGLDRERYGLAMRIGNDMWGCRKLAFLPSLARAGVSDEGGWTRIVEADVMVAFGVVSGDATGHARLASPAGVSFESSVSQSARQATR